MPIGLIETCWSGTRIATWSSPEALAMCEAHEDEQDEHGAAELGTDGKTAVVGAPPPPPTSPSVLWNGMWAAIVRFPITGVVW